jgi:hypothetical protein
VFKLRLSARRLPPQLVEDVADVPGPDVGD